MAIAHQSEILGADNAASGNYDTAITPSAASDAVCVVIVESGTSSDIVTSCTYGTGAGAVTLTRLRFDSELNEFGSVYIYWGVGLPTGTQTVRIARTGTQAMRAAISTMTCGAGASIAVDVTSTGTSAGTTNPSWAMTTLATVTQCYLGIFSGLDTMTNTPATNWVLAPTPGFDDLGLVGRGWARRAAVAAANQLPGWIAAQNDNYVGSSAAFKEVPGLPILVMPQRVQT